MKEKWVVVARKGDFQGIAEAAGIDQVTARILVNRGISDGDKIREFLQGSMDELPDPHLLKDGQRAAEIVKEKIIQKKPIRIIGDYDIDGVMSTYILKAGLIKLDAVVDARIPHRVYDGYGLNARLIRQAEEDGVDTILTCDNGIAAVEEIALAKELGMTVVVTDHHSIPYREEDGRRIYTKSRADAVVNPHQQDCAYPFKDICGAVVAWKFLQLLYEQMGRAADEVNEYIENAAFATVGDIMPLIGENRILVREGLKKIRHTENIGMQALIRQCGVDPEQISAYHFGFVLGPCINASGRLDSAEQALALFFEQDPAKADQMAQVLTGYNERRKELTEQGVEAAVRQYESEGYAKDPVPVFYLPMVHESVAGIVAGRIRERCYKPVFVLTDSRDCVKGSGRSVEEYSMYEEMSRCNELFIKYGGHPAAAGLSLPRENVERFRERINALCPQDCRDLSEKIRIDVPVPVGYLSLPLVRELESLEPYGKDNPRPLFAEKNMSVRRMKRIGSRRKGLRFLLESGSGAQIEAIFFRDAEGMEAYLARKYGETQVKRAFWGMENQIQLSVTYHPAINRFGGQERLQISIENYK